MKASKSRLKTSKIRKTRKTSSSDTIERRAMEFLRQKMKEKKLKPADMAKALTPPLSESQLRHLLNGGSSITLDRFFQLAKLAQIDPFEILHHSNPNPQFEMPFSVEQEKFLVRHPWHFKILKALGLQRTEKELIKLFPECSHIPEILSDLLRMKFILKQDTGDGAFFRVNASPFQLTSIDFVDGYPELLVEIVKEMQQTIAICERERRDLIKFIRYMFVVDYLTPEQMMSLRDRLRAVYNEFRDAVGRNRMDPSYGTVAKDNLVGFVTIVAPLNRTTFLQKNWNP